MRSTRGLESAVVVGQHDVVVQPNLFPQLGQMQVGDHPILAQGQLALVEMGVGPV